MQSRPSLKKITPNELFDFAFSNILKALNEQKETDVEIIEPLTESEVYGARFIAQGKTLVLTSPAFDPLPAQEGKQTEYDKEASSLQQVLEKVRSLQKKYPDETYLTPLVKSQKVLGLVKRPHWTMLMIQGNEAYLFDPSSNPIFRSSSLKVIKTLLDEMNVHLRKEHISYLNWQRAGLDSGCYCGLIAERVAGHIFSKGGKAKINLALPGLKPVAANLADEFVNCRADKRIISSLQICEARQHGYLKHRLMLADLLQPTRETKNEVLTEHRASRYFWEGKGGLSQVKADFIRGMNTFILDKQVLDYSHNLTLESLTDLFVSKKDKILVNEDKVIAAQYKTLAEHFILAHSQNPLYLLPNLVSFGIEEPQERTLIVRQPKGSEGDCSVHYFHSGNGSLGMHLVYNRFPILSLKEDVKVIGYLRGPVLALCQLKNIAGAWGWELQYIETDNADILRLLDGQMLTELYLKRHLCCLPEFEENRALPQLLENATQEQELITASEEEGRAQGQEPALVLTLDGRAQAQVSLISSEEGGEAQEQEPGPASREEAAIMHRPNPLSPASVSALGVFAFVPEAVQAAFSSQRAEKEGELQLEQQSPR